MKNKRKVKNNEEIEKAITNMIDDGSEGVTTLSSDPEAKYEAIDDERNNES